MRCVTFSCVVLEVPVVQCIEHEELSNTVIEKTTTLFEKKHQLQGQLRSLNIADTHSNAPVTPTTASFENDTTSLWEDAFGHFGQRYIIHNPQIIYNNSVRNLIYRFLDLQLQERALDYYMSMAAVKFLRELTVSATKKTISSAPAMAEMEDAFDQKMAEELIQLLVSQEDSNLVAQNETEEAYKQEKENSNSSATSSYNDPIHQRENIPEGYSMMSESLVELLNPQISLQSETAPDSIVIVTAERIQLTSFKVLDNSFLGDATNELVKSRMIFSIDKAQFFVAAKDDFDSEELLLDNHYGARGRQYWLTWIPLEMLMDELGRTGKFQRVAERTAVSMQYDSYNPLRLKSNVNGAGKSSSSSMMSEADERSDSMHLNFPHLVFTANSAQYTAIHEVVSDLLLYKEPARKERLERLQEILLAADLDNLINALDDVVFLQDQMRQLRDLRDQYRENLAILNELQLQEFRAYKGQLLNVQEELYLMMEAITKAQSHKKEQRQDPKTNLKMVFSADKMVWTMMLDSSQPLCEWTLTKANFIWVSKEDHSSQNTLEVDQLQLVSKLASSRFSELISPYLESKKSVDFTRQKMLRGYLHNLPPVGGIAVVQHLEINLFPLKFRMTYDFGKQLVSYIFPEKRRAVTVSEDLNANTASVLVSESRDLQADSDQASRLSSTPTNGDGKIGSKHRSNSFVIKLNDNKGDLRPATSKSETVRQGDSQPQRDADQESTNSSSTQLSKKTLKKPVKQNSANVTTTKASDELALMKARASRNRTFIYIKIPGVPHCLSYQFRRAKSED
ncbi:golgi-body localization protein domain-containing protein [Jimgerdemannia flammicorona]|uniref:Golgi-body localization protein domain-containing protein n=1 Tax=Jimgerdemannia flammicorona TaxID=994334 RepID=A0A433D619_9FUNG|nr:golgi-body localization protein domain-containing protein [Jimgerdemannia flammicorona]